MSMTANYQQEVKNRGGLFLISMRISICDNLLYAVYKFCRLPTPALLPPALIDDLPPPLPLVFLADSYPPLMHFARLPGWTSDPRGSVWMGI